MVLNSLCIIAYIHIEISFSEASGRLEILNFIRLDLDAERAGITFDSGISGSLSYFRYFCVTLSYKGGYTLLQDVNNREETQV